MAAISPAVTISQVTDLAGGSPTITWTRPRLTGRRFQKFQIGAYRVDDRTAGAPLDQIAPPPFDYIPVAASGYPNLAYGVLPDPAVISPRNQSITSFTFNGGYPSARALPNGTFIIWLHIILETEDAEGQVIARDNGVATRQITVTGSPVVEPRRLHRVKSRVEPDPPRIINPVEGHAFTNGIAAFRVQMPRGIVADQIKMAVYREGDIDRDSKESSARPVSFTDRHPPGSDTGAEWVDLDLFETTKQVSNGLEDYTITFDGAEGRPLPVPNGEWVAAVRYNTEVTGRILSYNQATGFVRSPHMYHASDSALIGFSVSGGEDDTSVPIPVVYIPRARPHVTFPRPRFTNRVDMPLSLEWFYSNGRGVEQRSVKVRRVLMGGSNAGTRYLARSPSGVYSWVTALDTTNNTTDIPITTHQLVLAAGGGNVSSSWGDLTWGTHQFDVRPTSRAGIEGDWSDKVRVDVYGRLDITTLAVTVNSGGHIQAVWTHNGGTTNNAQARYRVQVFNDRRRIVSGTSEREEDQYRPGLRARAIRDTRLSFTLNRDLPSMGPVVNGTYTVRLTLWDKYGNVSAPVSRTITVNNTAPVAVAATPRAYGIFDVLVPGTTGYYEGEYLGVSFSPQLNADHWAVRLERREQNRQAGGELLDDPLPIAVLRKGATALQSLERYNDESVKSGVGYQYRAVAINNSGAELAGDWGPA